MPAAPVNPDVPPIEVDDSQGVLVIVRFRGAATDAQFAEYLARYQRHLEGQTRVGAVFTTAETMPLPAPRQVRLQARFMKDFEPLLRERVIGVAFSLGSPLMRGVLRGILKMQPMPCPHVVVGTEAEGISWVRAKLWTDNVRRLKSERS